MLTIADWCFSIHAFHPAMPSCIFGTLLFFGKGIPCRHFRAGFAAKKNGEIGVRCVRHRG